MSDRDELEALEAARCEAIASGDIEALDAMLAEDYVHVYGGGLSSGKAEWMAHITDVPRAPERAELKVRVYGDAAVLTGKMINRIRPREGAGPAEQIGDRIPVKEDVRAFATQVAVRTDGEWKFCSFQMTRCVD